MDLTQDVERPLGQEVSVLIIILMPFSPALQPEKWLNRINLFPV